MAARRFLIQVLWDSWMHMSLLSASRFLSHLMPCSCGSMMRGQRLQELMMAPFSREMRSAGRPSLIILAFLPSSVSMSMGSLFSLMGTPLASRSGVHVSCHRRRRKALSKAPM